MGEVGVLNNRSYCCQTQFPSPNPSGLFQPFGLNPTKGQSPLWKPLNVKGVDNKRRFWNPPVTYGASPL